MNANDIRRFKDGYATLCSLSGQPFGTDATVCGKLISNAVMAGYQALNRSELYENMMAAYAFDMGVLVGCLHGAWDKPIRVEEAQLYANLPAIEFSHETAVADEKQKEAEKPKVVVPERKLVVVQ